eukprot:CAMPEP_0204843462 /NCGR_PEP_ID=MMETSP1346-20131115/47992_1 /ASSEMBLY_ACC=CAM_ASM_000771 /TAXON_ID=215587 /ORGANISM="Aplanochytrium stocchinoi, Strain GSBS06" /LENGTH=335 /DNA_ID=CAMNT_0051982609 /DNA_START=433 /DNA_END=1440 /DNA_ORIENTATION=-
MTTAMSGSEMQVQVESESEPVLEMDIHKVPREKVMALAMLAHQVGRPSEAADYMISAIRAGFEKSPDVQINKKERLLLAKVYKEKVGELRTAVKNMDSLLHSPDFPKDERAQNLMSSYRKQVVKELVESCLQIVCLVSEILLPTARDSEVKVSMSKMAGDYSWYIAQIPTSSWIGVDVREIENGATGAQTPEELVEYVIFKTEEFYTLAYTEAQTHLSPTHPIRLELELNLAVFYYEVKQDTNKAIDFAKDAYDDAIAELDEEYHEDLDSTLDSSTGIIREKEKEKEKEDPKHKSMDKDVDALDSNGNKKHGVTTTLKLLKEKLQMWERRNNKNT